MSEASSGLLSRQAKRLFGYRTAATIMPEFVLACVLLTIPTIGLALLLTQGGWGILMALAAFLAIAVPSGLGLKKSYPHDRLGVANLVTLGRAAMIAGLCAPLSQPGLLTTDAMIGWMVLLIAVVALCLDGVDGYYARRDGLVSDFGARFDMEIDSIFALLLAVLALQSGKAGIWVLVLGGMRYLFVLASFVWPWLNGKLPERQSRKVICVVQIGVLIALLAPIITGVLSWIIAGVTTALLIYSFGRDIVWLARHRR